MGTLTAGIKEIFSSAKTTGSNVMLCGNDGTPDGHMTMANLANVLGVNNIPILTLNQLETITKPGIYYSSGSNIATDVIGEDGFAAIFNVVDEVWRLKIGMGAHQKTGIAYKRGNNDWVVWQPV